MFGVKRERKIFITIYCKLLGDRMACSKDARLTDNMIKFYFLYFLRVLDLLISWPFPPDMIIIP